MTVITFAATGDSLLTRRLPEGDKDALRVASILKAADVRFTNLEVVVRRSEGFPSAQSGGTWVSAAPEVLEDLRQYGFNMVAWANNHTLDYSYGGLAATERYLEQYGFIHAGAGANRADAGAVRYLEADGARIALIAATATFHESWSAGEQRPDMQGRPGVNPLRFQTINRVSASRLRQLEEIAGICAINAKHDMSVQGGFASPEKEGIYRFGQHLFEAAADGEAEGATTSPHPADMRRIAQAVNEAKRQADLVLVSIHAHEMKDSRKNRPADFLVAFARACIDAGAHAVVGHGPHLVRGIEVYKDRPILYSLGNFIFQNETVERLPADFYEKYGLGPEHMPADALETRSAGDSRGFGASPEVWSSVIAVWSMEDGRLKDMVLHPISLGYGKPRYRRGWPALTDDASVLHELQALSREFGTELRIEDGKARWGGGSFDSRGRE